MTPSMRRALSLAAERDDGRALEVDSSPKLRIALVDRGYIVRGEDAQGRGQRPLPTHYITPAGRAALSDDKAPAPNAGPALPNVPANTSDVFVVVAEYGYDPCELIFASRARGTATDFARTTTDGYTIALYRMRGAERIEVWRRDGEGAELVRVK